MTRNGGSSSVGGESDSTDEVGDSDNGGGLNMSGGSSGGEDFSGRSENGIELSSFRFIYN
jgi:hypothetical protein